MLIGVESDGRQTPSTGRGLRPDRHCSTAYLSETVTDIEAVNPGVDLDCADVQSINRQIGLDVDPAYVQVDQPVVIEHPVGAKLRGDAEGVVETQACLLYTSDAADECPAV